MKRKHVRRLRGFLSNCRGTIALIIALAAPLLIAATALSVDAGFWYQQQDTLQSAADAAALAAANAANYGAASVENVEPLALAAANMASNNQFSLTSAQLVLSNPPASTTASGTKITAWQATATIPRGSFFSAVKGLGLPGEPAGTQSATAVADMVKKTGSSCLISEGTIVVSGGASIVGSNCGISSNAASCPSMTVTGSGIIQATSVVTAASCISAPQYSGYIGTDPKDPPGAPDTVVLNTSTPDPLAGLNAGNVVLWNPGWSVPAAPVEHGSAVTPNLGYNTWNQAGVGDCTQMKGKYSADCELYPNYLTGMNNAGVVELILNEGVANGSTFITGGLGGQANTSLTMNGSNYYINGGMNFTSDSTFSLGSGTQSVPVSMVVNGGMSLTNGTATLNAGTYYLTGVTSGTKVTGWGLLTNVPSVSIDGSNYYVDGGVNLAGGTTATAISSGLYEFNAYSGNSDAANGSGGAFYAAQGNLTIGSTPPVDSTPPAPATYYFDGGLNISNGTKTVVLNPGVYYIRNGNLIIDSGTNVTGVGVTFVLEGTAAYIFNGGATVNITAPTDNCVSPADYPESSYENPNSPYDGTNGEGICGVAIYQARGDATTDIINEGAASTFNGAIYAPSAPLTMSGAGALNIATTGVPGLVVASVNDSGSGNIKIAETLGAGGSGGVTMSTALLVQ
ncbi:hypothetical protein GCM10010909_11740 [Acidocella aquatica]|uniref:Putative Flp pilus-assembly TadG-like N-terminal domain-containing protein n=1 Tax=Acidocella aquatica TaxID=1922313 RepID=A0ABQ6A8N1_9PROT|nr:pilus assembly protein TadG-related protein [Acidocella aquatica]GLR66494.1 hypothetical protein GCM10010909_11740 [Acidocella aquatica]